jgi:hypothetical protein
MRAHNCTGGAEWNAGEQSQRPTLFGSADQPGDDGGVHAPARRAAKQVAIVSIFAGVGGSAGPPKTPHFSAFGPFGRARGRPLLPTIEAPPRARKTQDFSGITARTGDVSGARAGPLVVNLSIAGYSSVWLERLMWAQEVRRFKSCYPDQFSPQAACCRGPGPSRV